TYSHLAATAGALLTAGWSVVVDAAFLRRDQRAAFAAVAEQHGCAFVILHCDAPAEVLRARIAHRQHDASEATLDVLDAQIAAADPLTEAERAQTLPRPAKRHNTGHRAQ
ncbi:MAG: ATP-binding protein, partial [Actinomycetes bacterium]